MGWYILRSPPPAAPAAAQIPDLPRAAGFREGGGGGEVWGGGAGVDCEREAGRGRDAERGRQGAAGML